MGCKPKNKKSAELLGDFILGVIIIVIFSAIAITAYQQILKPEHDVMHDATEAIQCQLDSISTKIEILEENVDSLMVRFNH